MQRGAASLDGASVDGSSSPPGEQSSVASSEQTTGNSETQTADTGTILGRVRDTALIIAVYLYFTGFTYIYAYDDYFGIPFDLSNKPVYQAIVYSYGVVSDYWFPLLLLGSTLAALLLLATYFKNRGTIGIHVAKSITTVASLVAAVLLFPLLDSWAFDDADRTSVEVRDGADVELVKFMLKSNRKKLFDAQFLKMNEAMNLVLLAENDEAYFVLRQDPAIRLPSRLSKPATTRYRLPPGYVYAIRKTDVDTYINHLDEDHYEIP